VVTWGNRGLQGVPAGYKSLRGLQAHTTEYIKLKVTKDSKWLQEVTAGRGGTGGYRGLPGNKG